MTPDILVGVVNEESHAIKSFEGNEWKRLICCNDLNVKDRLITALEEFKLLRSFEGRTIKRVSFEAEPIDKVINPDRTLVSINVELA